MKIFPLVALMVTAVTVVIGGCTRINFPYRIDVEQGDVLSQEAVDLLQPGMARQQVAFALGTPLITNDFRPERWDYFYSFQSGRGGPALKRRLALFFHGDALVRIEGDMRPGGGDDAVSDARRPEIDQKAIKEPPPGADRERYIDDRIEDMGGRL